MGSGLSLSHFTSNHVVRSQIMGSGLSLSHFTSHKSWGHKSGGQVFHYHISPHTALGPAFCRVEIRLPPALPRQTMHAVFPHTVFRYSSHLVMRRFPAKLELNAGQGWPARFVADSITNPIQAVRFSKPPGASDPGHSHRREKENIS